MVLPMHLQQMLFEIVKPGPLFVCFGTALTETLVGLAGSILYLVDRLHMSISVIAGGESFLLLRAVRDRTLELAYVASRMLSVCPLVIRPKSLRSTRTLT